MKFKVGDWVRSKENKFDFSLVSIDTEKFYKALGSNFEDAWELWQPKEGEWCWYKNNLVKIIDITDCIYVKATPASFMDRFVFFVDFLECEPFIGQLPSSVKENK